MINPANNNSITTLFSGTFNSPRGVAAGSDGKVYVANYAAGGGTQVYVIDTANNNAITAIPGFNGPWGVALAPNGKVYVTNFTGNSVSVINPAANNSVTTFTDAGFNAPNGVAVAATAPCTSPTPAPTHCR